KESRSYYLPRCAGLHPTRSDAKRDRVPSSVHREPAKVVCPAVPSQSECAVFGRPKDRRRAFLSPQRDPKIQSPWELRYARLLLKDPSNEQKTRSAHSLLMSRKLRPLAG